MVASMFRSVSMKTGWVVLLLACLFAGHAAAAAPDADPYGGDPFQSFQWPDLKKEFLRNAPTVFDARVQVRVPAFAEDPMNVPVSVSVTGLPDVEEIIVLVDRNPIRKVLAYFPVSALPSVSFRFKLEQASPVRALARTRDGVWHVGGAMVDSSGGGCTVAGASRKDGSWDRTLGQVSARLFENSFDNATPVPGFALSGAARLRLRVMHPMDTGLANGIPAFYVNHLSVRDSSGTELLRLATFEPVSENPVFSFDFAGRQTGALTVVGSDNNGNRIQSRVE
jgi:sulfur-oxidizing protein SoxY